MDKRKRTQKYLWRKTFVLFSVFLLFKKTHKKTRQ